MGVRFNKAAFQSFLDGPAQRKLTEIANEILVEAERQAPVATGDLKHSGQVTSIRSRFGRQKAVQVAFTADHARAVEEGTGALHQPNANAPYIPKLRKRGLILWSDSKGLNPYAVQKAIGNRGGTPPNPFLRRAIENALRTRNFRWTKED